MKRRSQRALRVVLIGMGLITLALAWTFSSQSPVVIARFAFQSPGVMGTPASPPEAGMATPPEVQLPDEGQATESNPQVTEPFLPKALEPATPPEGELSALRSLVLAFGYVWLGCGVLLLITIPLALVWLNWRGRRTKP
ncbi:MAG: hypothetical protein RML36_16580 [Anaerolineae bacterium]|nr:hypothetical protein [Anaerolineae bacterium]MDW8101090.1 hypothetical protein [Anaerolineae bacterium]